MKSNSWARIAQLRAGPTIVGKSTAWTVPAAGRPGAMQRIAVGPGDDNLSYTESVMKAWKAHGADQKARR